MKLTIDGQGDVDLLVAPLWNKLKLRGCLLRLKETMTTESSEVTWGYCGQIGKVARASRENWNPMVWKHVSLFRWLGMLSSLAQNPWHPMGHPCAKVRFQASRRYVLQLDTWWGDQGHGFFDGSDPSSRCGEWGFNNGLPSGELT